MNEVKTIFRVMHDGQISLESYSDNALPIPHALVFYIFHCARCGINLSHTAIEEGRGGGLGASVVRCKNGHENRVD